MPEAKEITISNEMWEKYHEKKSIYLRNKILTNYLHIVTINAKRMSSIYRTKADLEDIVNQGVIALIECIERYDPERGVQFESFASIRIRGAIIDYLRKQDWVPRSIRAKFIHIEKVSLNLQASLNRHPTDEELAESTGMEISEVQKTVSQSQSFSILSYEELLDGANKYENQVSPIKVPEQTIQDKEIKSIIASSIDNLNEKERLIISLYYYEELKLKEIAVILGISSSRVSQIHTKALLKMSETLNEYIKEC